MKELKRLKNNKFNSSKKWLIIYFYFDVSINLHKINVQAGAGSSSIAAATAVTTIAGGGLGAITTMLSLGLIELIRY